MPYPHSEGIAALAANGGYVPVYAYGGPIPKYGLGSWLKRHTNWAKGIGALLDIAKYAGVLAGPLGPLVSGSAAALKKGLIGDDVGLFDWKLSEGEEIGGEGWKNALLEGVKSGAMTWLGGKALKGAHLGKFAGTPEGKFFEALGGDVKGASVLGGLRSLTSSEGLRGLAGELTRPEHRFFTLPGISEVARQQGVEDWKRQMEEGGGAYSFAPPTHQYQMATQQAHDLFNQQFGQGQGQAPGPGSLYTYRLPDRLPERQRVRTGADGGYLGGYKEGGSVVQGAMPVPTDWLRDQYTQYITSQLPGTIPDPDFSDSAILRWAYLSGTPNTEGGWEGGPGAGVTLDDTSNTGGDPNDQFGGALPGDPGSTEPLDGGDEGTLIGSEDERNRPPNAPVPGSTARPPLPPPLPPMQPGFSNEAPVPVEGTGRTPMAIHEGYRPGYHGEYQYFKGPDDTTTPSDVMANLGVGAFSEDDQGARTPTGPAPIGIHPEDVNTMTQEEIAAMVGGIGGNEPMYTPPIEGIIPTSADGGPIDPRMAAMAPPGMGQPSMAPTEMALSPQEIDMALQELAKAISAGDDNKIDMMFEYFGPELFQQLINMLMGEQRANADGFATNGGLLDDKGAGPRADDLLASVNGDPILLSGDEFVVNADATQKIGPENLQAMMDAANAGQMGMMI